MIVSVQVPLDASGHNTDRFSYEFPSRADCSESGFDWSADCTGGVFFQMHGHWDIKKSSEATISTC